MPQLTWEFVLDKGDQHILVLEFSRWGGNRTIKLDGKILRTTWGYADSSDLLHSFKIRDYECVLTMNGVSHQGDFILNGISMNTGFPVVVEQIKEEHKQKSKLSRESQLFALPYLLIFGLGRPFVDSCLANFSQQVMASGTLVGVSGILALVTVKIIQRRERTLFQKIIIALPVTLIGMAIFTLSLFWIISRYQLRFDCALLRSSFFLDLLKIR